MARKLHPNLRRDLQEAGAELHAPPSPEVWRTLLRHLDETYRSAETAKTEVAHSSQELREVREIAKAAANAEKARAQFIANMSHELRTPLNAIIGYSEMLAEELEELDEADLVEDVHRVERSGRHLLKLINDILDLSKMDAGRMDLQRDLVDLAVLAQEVREKVLPQCLDQANELFIEIDPDVGEIITDAMRLRQCLVNLLANAIKFTQGGEIHLKITRNGRWHRFQVVDTGIGMTVRQQARIFAEFTQADASTTRKYAGTGLGLTLTRRFVGMLSGSITVESTPGEGSTFTIDLPDLAHSIERAEELGRLADAYTVDDQVVLVVDDDPDVIELVTRILKRDGFKVAGALDGKRAIELAYRLAPRLLILDVVLPGMTGWEVLTHFKADDELSRIPVMMLSTVDDRTRGLSLGAEEYLVKPIQRDRLLQTVQKLHAQQVGQDILVVDDDYATRRLLRRYLSREGWVVRTAAHGREALARVAEQRPGLILLDLMMPVMDGVEFIHHLRSEATYDDVPVIVTTAKDLSLQEQKSLASTVSLVVSKNAHTMEEILGEVREILPSPS